MQRHAHAPACAHACARPRAARLLLALALAAAGAAALALHAALALYAAAAPLLGGAPAADASAAGYASSDPYCVAQAPRGAGAPPPSVARAGAAAGIVRRAGEPAPRYALARAALVARHGDRSPLTVYDGDGYDAAWASPMCPRADTPAGAGEGQGSGVCYPGQLTARGAAQLRRNGEALRARFGRAPAVEVHCTHIPRTRDSAHALLAGLLGDTRAAEVEVQAQPEGPLTWLYPNRKHCAALGSTPAAHALGEAAADAAGYEPVSHWELGEHMGSYDDRRVRLFDLYATRRCHQPAAQSSGFPCGGECGFGQLKRAATAAEVAPFLQARASGEAAMAMQVGPLMHGLTTFLAGEHRDPSVELLYFSGHDTTLMPLLVALGVWEAEGVDGVWPPYASTVLFSVWRAESSSSTEGVRAPEAPEEVVLVEYNGRELVLPACAEPCTPTALREGLAGLALTEEAWLQRCSDANAATVQANSA